MDVRHQHGSQLHVLRACNNPDATDLVAIGGEHSVQVVAIVRCISPRLRATLISILQSDAAATLIASFHIGSRITALAWSPRAVAPSASDSWFLE